MTINHSRTLVFFVLPNPAALIPLQPAQQYTQLHNCNGSSAQGGTGQERGSSASPLNATTSSPGPDGWAGHAFNAP